MPKPNLSITALFDAIPDPRRKAGQRHDKTFMLLLVLMSVMSGYSGYRAMGDFIHTHRSALLRHFRPHKDRLPSFDVLRRLLNSMDFDAFSGAFYQWAARRVPIRKGEWISMDGKAIAGTLTGLREPHQRFVMLVSLYCSKAGLALGFARVDNSKQSEGAVVRTLIETLGLKDVVFTLDALHCQKKL